jgi:predicted metalloprotease with PDZ domain
MGELMIRRRLRSVLIALFLLTFAAGGAAADPQCPQPMPPEDRAYPGAIQLLVTAADLERRILHVREEIPVAGGRELVLLYPEWLPGTHAPRGRIRINKLAGLTIAANGAPVPWTRDPSDIFAFHLTPPEAADRITVEFDYLSPDGSPGEAVEVTSDILVLEWSSVVLYPAGYPVSQIKIDPKVILPDGWPLAAALEPLPASPPAVSFKSVSLETLVDSPLFAGRHVAVWDLDPNSAVPVRLDIFADGPELLEFRPEWLAAHRALIQEAYKLFGAKHYDHYDFLVSLSDKIGGTGLEHHRSSQDQTAANYFTEWDKAISLHELLPHEYAHSWNGKFRRPAGLATPNYNVPMQDDLLWVYEGQTQYWGKVLAARSGLWSKNDALDAIANVAAYYKEQAGRRWRNLQDTTYDEVVAPRFLPRAWASWRRSEDYYDEGLLIWLDADTLIREQSQGQRSLDDFARRFFGIKDGCLGPDTYTFEDVAAALNDVLPYDWRGFLLERLQSLDRDPIDGISRGGYRLVYSQDAGKYYENLESRGKSTSFWYSIGLSVDHEGKIRGVRWDGPAFKAGLSPGMQIQAVNGVMSDATARLKEAVKVSVNTTGPIELTVKDQDYSRVARIDYHDGARYPHLQPIQVHKPLLDCILAARASDRAGECTPAVP